MESEGAELPFAKELIEGSDLAEGNELIDEAEQSERMFVFQYITHYVIKRRSLVK